MGGWRMETLRMLIYVTFPVGSFWLYNQPEIFNRLMKNWEIPNNKENGEALRKWIEDLNAEKRKQEYESFLRDQVIKMFNFVGKKYQPEPESDSPSEATMIFNRKAEAAFKKAFPLKSEKEAALRPPERRPLNFDETLTLENEKVDMNAALQESRLMVDALQQKVQALEREREQWADWREERETLLEEREQWMGWKAERESLLRENTATTKDMESLQRKYKNAEERVTELLEERSEWRRQSSLQQQQQQQHTQHSLSHHTILSQSLHDTTIPQQKFSSPKHPPMPEPTDAGDSTRILHWAANPLDIAHREMLEEQQRQDKENRKRKMGDTEAGNEQASASRKQLQELTEKNERLEAESKRKDQLFEYQNRMTRKFREMVTHLSGFEFKLRSADTGEIEVRSIYNNHSDDGTFLFKCDDEGVVELLEYDTVSSSQSIETKWAHELRIYLGEHNSIPAFLAAVTQKLESERDFESAARNHTISVLHQD